MTTHKRQRFRIFTRDSFTCRYCGRQPPAVTLEPNNVIHWMDIAVSNNVREYEAIKYINGIAKNARDEND